MTTTYTAAQQADAVRAIGQAAKANGVDFADLTRAFRRRPRNNVEALEVISWINSYAKAAQDTADRLRGTEQTKSINPPTPAPSQAKPKFVTAEMLPEGNYAVPGKDGGKTRFYRVSHKAGKGKWAGTTFVNIKERASDELYDLPSRAVEGAAKWSIVNYGPEQAGLLFAEKYERCRKCFIGLTDEDNPYKAYGYGPDCGPKVMGAL